MRASYAEVMTAPQNPFDPSGTPPSVSSYGPPPQPGQLAQGAGPTQTETKAWVALGLAIAAYTPTVPFIGAIAAIVLARMARRDILASGGRLTGLELCTWAVVLSVVHLVLLALVVVLVLAAFLGLLVLPFSLGP